MSNYCMCCLKKIAEKDSNKKTTPAKDNQMKSLHHLAYHPACIKKLFGTNIMPSINVKSTELAAEISKSAGKMSISGVQIKALVKINRSKNLIEFVQSGGTHILKPEPGEYPQLPQNENLCMCLAETAAGFDVPPHGLFYMADGKICYIIKRFDRDADGQKIHVEDMAQLLDMPPDSKYESSLEKVGNAILKFSKRPYLDLIDFFERILFCFVVGNGDMHLKNWSLIQQPRDHWHLAPCYDLISSKIYLPHEDESALTINGKRNRLSLDDFTGLGNYLKIDARAAKNAVDKIVGLKEKMLFIIEGSNYFSRAEDLKKIVLERLGRISYL